MVQILSRISPTFCFIICLIGRFIASEDTTDQYYVNQLIIYCKNMGTIRASGCEEKDDALARGAEVLFDQEICKLLTTLQECHKRSIHLNRCDTNGYHLLYYGITYAKPVVIQLLLQHMNTKPNTIYTGKQHISPLLYAVQSALHASQSHHFARTEEYKRIIEFLRAFGYTIEQKHIDNLYTEYKDGPKHDKIFKALHKNINAIRM